jgi:pimeloyl-ACP methyl ester carboxylesterase
MAPPRRSVPLILALATLQTPARPPAPPGRLVDIGGGQRIHLYCTGRGAPTVVFEGGTGDFSVIWSLVQPGVSGFTRACSYDRAGYAWSDPGTRPRTFGQMALELRTALRKAEVAAPYVLVGQSFGGSLVRGYAQRYPDDVAGVVLVDAIHEDGYVFYGGEPHHLRDQAKARAEPTPHIALDAETARRARGVAPAEATPLEDPLTRLPGPARRIWQWASAQPVYRLVQPLELDWSADEAERTYQRRRTDPASLGSIPLIVLARTAGGYPSGMSISPDSLERLRRVEQADLARLSLRGELRYAPHSGHNIHLEDPAFVVRAVRDVVDQVRHAASATSRR